MAKWWECILMKISVVWIRNGFGRGLTRLEPLGLKWFSSGMATGDQVFNLHNHPATFALSLSNVRRLKLNGSRDKREYAIFGFVDPHRKYICFGQFSRGEWNSRKWFPWKFYATILLSKRFRSGAEKGQGEEKEIERTAGKSRRKENVKAIERCGRFLKGYFTAFLSHLIFNFSLEQNIVEATGLQSSSNERTHTPTHTQTHTHTHIHKHTYTLTHLHTYIDTHTHPHTDMSIRTNTLCSGLYHEMKMLLKHNKRAGKHRFGTFIKCLVFTFILIKLTHFCEICDESIRWCGTHRIDDIKHPKRIKSEKRRSMYFCVCVSVCVWYGITIASIPVCDLQNA